MGGQFHITDTTVIEIRYSGKKRVTCGFSGDTNTHIFAQDGWKTVVQTLNVTQRMYTNRSVNCESASKVSL